MWQGLFGEGRKKDAKEGRERAVLDGPISIANDVAGWELLGSKCLGRNTISLGFDRSQVRTKNGRTSIRERTRALTLPD